GGQAVRTPDGVLGALPEGLENIWRSDRYHRSRVPLYRGSHELRRSRSLRRYDEGDGEQDQRSTGPAVCRKVPAIYQRKGGRVQPSPGGYGGLRSRLERGVDDPERQPGAGDGAPGPPILHGERDEGGEPPAEGVRRRAAAR